MIVPFDQFYLILFKTFKTISHQKFEASAFLMYFFIFPHRAIFKQFSLTIIKTIIMNAIDTIMVSKCV